MPKNVKHEASFHNTSLQQDLACSWLMVEWKRLHTPLLRQLPPLQLLGWEKDGFTTHPASKDAFAPPCTVTNSKWGISGQSQPLWDWPMPHWYRGLSKASLTNLVTSSVGKHELLKHPGFPEKAAISCPAYLVCLFQGGPVYLKHKEFCRHKQFQGLHHWCWWMWVVPGEHASSSASLELEKIISPEVKLHPGIRLILIFS